MIVILTWPIANRLTWRLKHSMSLRSGLQISEMHVKMKVPPFQKKSVVSFEATYRGGYFVTGTDSPAINTL